VNRVHNAPWSGCPNKNVFNDRLNREYDKSVFLKSDEKLFRNLVTASTKVLSPKQYQVKLCRMCERLAQDRCRQLRVTSV